MRHALTSILSAAVVCGVASAAPTSAHALVRHAHKAEHAQRHLTPYPPNPGDFAYPNYNAYVPGYSGGSFGELHHPTGCANCPPE